MPHRDTQVSSGVGQEPGAARGKHGTSLYDSFHWQGRKAYFGWAGLHSFSRLWGIEAILSRVVLG